MPVQVAPNNRQVISPQTGGNQENFSQNQKISSETQGFLQNLDESKILLESQRDLNEIFLDIKKLETEAKPETSEDKKVVTALDNLKSFLKENNLDSLSNVVHHMADAKNPTRKLLATWVNGAAALINLSVEASPFLKDNPISSLIGKTAYRSFLTLNCSLGALSGLKQNRALMAAANLVDIPFAFLPAKWIYSARRLYAGLMELDNAGTKSSKSELKPAKGKAFNSLSDSIKVVTDRIKELPGEVAGDISKIMSDSSIQGANKVKEVLTKVLLNNEKGVMGFIGALGSLSGLALNGLGLHKLGKFIGDVVGMTGLVLDRASFQNLEKGRFFNWASGVFFGLGAVGDLTGQLHLQMGSDAVAKIFTQISNARGEIAQKDLEAIAHPFKNPPKFIKQATQKLAEEFLLKKEEAVA
ncbi:MAG: hypothetical protein HRT47_04840 [Candidatus Caenarcaniphilales bacterium]|nr:hypothetical protein [Candidatus Caenarcaniphilales bacterium]